MNFRQALWSGPSFKSPVNLKSTHTLSQTNDVHVWDEATYLLMYSPVRAQPHFRHLKQVTCHCLSRANRDWPCLISSPQPAQSTKQKKTRAEWEQFRHFFSVHSLTRPLVCPSRCQMELPDPGCGTTWGGGSLVCTCAGSCREWGRSKQRVDTGSLTDCWLLRETNNFYVLELFCLVIYVHMLVLMSNMKVIIILSY